ncbi:MAG: preprotein translocase subunit SecE [Gammaproteobacteria bacterium]|nr:preprotein translocase subunit SecE [Gammaproteobacteria bacterium]MCD8542530.1 preprotein translocase subunit SecE [Gammaproteobacteria bacterium]
MLKALSVAGLASSRPKWLDFFLWTVSLVLLVGMFVFNYQMGDFSVYLNVLLWFFVISAVLVLVGLTRKGLLFVKFSKETRAELKKVHWPGRHETLQTTMIVVVVVVILGLSLWAFDSFFMWVINRLTS